MSKKTKIILGIAILIIIIGGVLYGIYSTNNIPLEERDVVEIGVIGHFSGEYASYSVPMGNAIELAVEEFNNKKDLDFRVELIIEDDGADATKAASAMNKLVNIDNVDYVLSAQGSGASSVIAPIAQSNQKILMITLGSAPGLTDEGEYIFRSIPSDNYQGVGMIDFINDYLESENVAGLYVNEAYGEGIKRIINENQNVEIVATEMFKPGAGDFRTQLLKIKTSNPDTLVLVARKNEYPIILRQINELELDVKILASETFKDDEVLNDSGFSAEGVYVAFQDEIQDYVDFDKKYQTKFIEEPSAYSMYAYDGATALLNAIEKGGDDIGKVQKELSKMQLEGASSKVSFDKDGDRLGIDYILYVVKNGKFMRMQ